LTGKGRGLVDAVKVELTICKVIETCRRVGMFWPKNLLPDPERFLVERLGFGVVPALWKMSPRLFRASAVSGCSGPPSSLCHFDELFGNRNSLLILSLFKQRLDLLIE
jgi:hypothetical protein